MIPCFRRVKQARSNERALNVKAVHAMPRKEACDQLGQDVGGLVMQTNVVSLWSPLGIDTVRHRGIGTGISEASKRVPIFCT